MNNKKANLRVHIETSINASADKVWKILAHQFVEIDKWSSTVELSRAITVDEIPKGMKAHKDAPVLGRYTESKLVKAKEILIDYSDEKREFTFSAMGLPKFMVVFMENNSKVKAVSDDASLLSFDISIRFTPLFSFMIPIMKKRMSKTFAFLQSELKTFAEKEQMVEAI